MWPTHRAGKSSGENPESWLARYAAGKVSTPPLGLAVKFPSPLASDYKRRGPKSSQQGLPEFVRMFPTPTASCGGKESNRATGKKLITVVSQFPTPRTKGMCGGSGAFQKMKALETQGIISSEERRQMTAGSGGQLNPTWVEWPMGWPLEWTALKPLATGKFLQWRQLHSGFCLADSKKERRGNESHS